MIVTRSEAFTDYLVWIKKGGHWDADVLDVIERRMRSDVDNIKSDGTGRFRPSLIGDTCNRVQLLSNLYTKVPEGNWMAWSGTWLHLAFQAFLLTIWPDRVLIEYPIAPVAGRLGVTGKADWYWFGPAEAGPFSYIAGRHLGDYKTLKSMDQIKDGPLPKHLEQLRYELATKRMTNAYLVYQVRGFGNMATYQLTMEPADHKQANDRLAVLESHRVSGVLPEMLTECRSRKGKFRTCDFADICVREATSGQ